MKKTPRLSKSGIEYLDYQWGIFSGCENWVNGICPVPNCWARSIAYRFPNHYPDGFNPHYYPEAIDSPKHLKKPSIIGVGWVGDVIGYGMEYKEQIYDTIRACPQHTFLFLTKNAEKLLEWSPFPDNCWVGVSATDIFMTQKAVAHLSGIEAKVKYISFEPLLGRIIAFGEDERAPSILHRAGINWVIIGAQTKPYKPPKIKWVQEILVACHNANIPVFMKNNLQPLLDKSTGWQGWKLRQEMPE